jgi:hypothetical protein
LCIFLGEWSLIDLFSKNYRFKKLYCSHSQNLNTKQKRQTHIQKIPMSIKDLKIMIIIYHRLASPTQTPLDAQKQIISQEIWGGIPRNGYEPKVQAYIGSLPPNADGIEFLTEIAPDIGCPIGQAFWSGEREGVRVEDDFAKIVVTITRCTQV